MRSIAHISLTNRAFIALATIVVLITGALSMLTLRQELIPQVELPQIAVVATLQGASADQINERVAEPVERSVQTIEDVERTTASSSSGVAIITIELVYGTDAARSANQVDANLNTLSSTFPEGTSTQVISGGTGEIPAAVVSVSADLETSVLAERISSVVMPEVDNITGVAQAQVIGAPERIVQVTPDTDAMDEAEVSEEDITDALAAVGMTVPSTPLTQDGVSYDVTIGAEVAGVEDLRSIPVLPTPEPPAQPEQLPQPELPPDQAPPGDDVPADEDAEPPQDPGMVPGQPQPPAAPEAPEPPEPVELGELAEVELTDREATSVSRTDGQPSLTVLIVPTATGNFVDISEDVHAVMDDVVPQVGGDASYVVVFDQAPFISESIQALAQEGGLGLIMAVLIILVFLAAVRPTLVTAVSIPTSLLMTFVGVMVAGYTLNVLTLAAITLSVGRVVDDSIVVIENINRHLRHGGDRRRRILDAVGEVAGAITAATLVTVIVFLPLAVVTGVAGELFRPFAFTVAIAMLASLLVALTIVPVLAYWFLRVEPHPEAEDRTAIHAEAAQRADDGEQAVGQPGAPGRTPAGRTSRLRRLRLALGRRIAGAPSPRGPAEQQPAAGGEGATSGAAARTTAVTGQRHDEGAGAASMRADGHPTGHEPTPDYPLTEVGADRNRLSAIYRPVLGSTQAHPVITVVASVVIFAASLALIPQLSVNFLSAPGQNLALVSQTLEPGTSLEESTERAAEAEDELMAHPDVETVQTTVGGGAMGFGGGSHEIQYAITTEIDADQVALTEELQSLVADLPDSGDVETTDFTGIASSAVDIQITGPTPDARAEATEQIREAVAALPEAADVTTDLQTDTPTIQVTVDRAEAADMGLTEDAVVGMIAQTVGDRAVGTLSLEGEDLDVYLTSQDAVETVDDLREVELLGNPIEDLAAIEEVLSVPEITTINTQQTVTVSVRPVDTDDVGGLSNLIGEELDDLDLPDGVAAGQAGAAEEIDEAFEQLGLALIAAVLLVYLLLVWLLKSLAQPLILLVSIPFAATGAILLMLATSTPLGVPALVGVLMLVGIVVTNSIVLMDLINQYRRRGLPLDEAVYLGSLRRLRPIVMTAAATIFALIPLALGVVGHTGFISAPLAIVTIGGLLSSTLLTLILVPVLYRLVEGAKLRRAERRAGRGESAAAV